MGPLPRQILQAPPLIFTPQASGIYCWLLYKTSGDVISIPKHQLTPQAAVSGTLLCHVSAAAAAGGAAAGATGATSSAATATTNLHAVSTPSIPRARRPKHLILT